MPLSSRLPGHLRRRWRVYAGTAVLALFILPGSEAARPAPHPGRSGALTPSEVETATIAWRYFENNYQPTTCLVNAVDGYPSTTIWDTASYMGALVSARELGILYDWLFDERMSCLLHTLATLPLYEGTLPNKAYDTRNAAMTDYGNNPGAIGYSALDIGRMLIWLRIVAERYPKHAEEAYSVVTSWSYCSVIDRCGTLFGAVISDGTGHAVQEGRLGYEEYAAKGYGLWGFDTTEASKPEPYELSRINDVDIPFDGRDPRVLGAHTYVVTESYALDGMELNWDRPEDRTSDDASFTDRTAADFAARVYNVQEARNARTGILTARSEHQLDAAPFFVYDTIYSDGYPWNTITDDGRYMPEAAAVSLKAAFSLWALWDTPYTTLLMTSVGGKFDPAKGFYEGVYEQSGQPIKTFTSNNNGIILEALLYKVQGKLLKRSLTDVDPWAGVDPKSARARCRPGAAQRTPCGPTVQR